MGERASGSPAYSWSCPPALPPRSTLSILSPLPSAQALPRPSPSSCLLIPSPSLHSNVPSQRSRSGTPDSAQSPTLCPPAACDAPIVVLRALSDYSLWMASLPTWPDKVLEDRDHPFFLITEGPPLAQCLDPKRQQPKCQQLVRLPSCPQSCMFPVRR